MVAFVVKAKISWTLLTFNPQINSIEYDKYQNYSRKKSSMSFRIVKPKSNISLVAKSKLENKQLRSSLEIIAIVEKCTTYKKYK